MAKNGNLKLMRAWRWAPFVLMALSLLMPNVAFFLKSGTFQKAEDKFDSLQYAFVFLFFIFGLVRYFPRWIAALVGILSLIAVFNFWYILSFSEPFNVNFLSVIAEAGHSEASDYLSSLPARVVGSVLFAAVLVVWIFVFPWRPGEKWPGWAFISLGAGISVIKLLEIIYQPSIDINSDGLSESSYISPFGARAAFVNSYPVGLPLLYYDYRRSRSAVIYAFENHKKYKFGVVRHPSNGEGRKIYIFVIGETGRGSRWQLNGYWRTTNPELSKRNDIIFFHDMLTPFVFTRISVPAMLTRAGLVDASTFEEGSIVKAFREAGFHTAWFSMQGALGFHESMVSSYAAEAETVRFINPSDYSARGYLDMVGVDKIMDWINSRPLSENLFIVFHTLGGHFRYTDRYPREDAKFLPDRPVGHVEKLYDKDDTEYLSNAYDNTIVYTDKVLNSLISRVDGLDDEAWVYYSADHGESLFDGCDMTAGHGQFNAQTQSVAAFFWASQKFSILQKNRMKNLRDRAVSPLSTIMTFETLSGLGGLEIKNQRKGYDISDDDILSGRPKPKMALCEK